jgi:hypothetical protein
MIGDEVGLAHHRDGREVRYRDAHQRGTGGYSFMNPSWSTVAWDESVRDLLDVSDEGKQAGSTGSVHAAPSARCEPGSGLVVDTEAPQSPARQAVVRAAVVSKRGRRRPAVAPTISWCKYLPYERPDAVLARVRAVRNRCGITCSVARRPGRYSL